MNVKVIYKHHYELFEVDVPVKEALFPGDEVFWSNGITESVSKSNIEPGDVFIKTTRIESHPVATTAYVVIDGVKYSATSKCHSEDQFSKRIGRSVAFDKLFKVLLDAGFEIEVLSEFELDVVK